ncbi:hypothetical protein [Demequina aestuarii]|uniref:hypothetical protein n=1 Tax=Demequina aestuarii TaxID=327095 RepID=UPI0007822D48|nr:hypothetical protein [Demequina aestuarii]
MADDLFSMFDAALQAEAAAASHADRDRAAATAVRSVRTRRRHRAVAVGAVALVAVPALAIAGYSLTAVDGAEPAVTPSPSTTAVQTPKPSPTPTTPVPDASRAAEPETWSDVPEADRPPYLTDQHPGEPRARAMEAWVWQYVDEEWTLETHQVGEPLYDLEAQSLLLSAPDGTIMRLFPLRLDYGIYVGHWDPARRIAWLERHEGGDGFEVVQMDLQDGSLASNWAGADIPQRLRTDDGMGSVRRVGDAPSGAEVWARISYFAPPYVVMFRDQNGGFIESLAFAWLERQWADGWGDRTGERLAESWIADDFSVAVYEVLDVDWSEDEGRTLGDSRWLWHDIDANTVTEVTPQLPDDQACWAPRGPSGEEIAPMVGARVVAECDDGNYLIDPRGERAPESYSG